MRKALPWAMLMASESLLADVGGVAVPGNVGSGALAFPQTHSNLRTHGNISSVIPFCAYINLDERSDRRERLERELAKVGLVCQRVSALTKDVSRNITAEQGHILSHVEALSQLRLSGAPYGLILEDDAVWSDVPRARGILWKMPKAMRRYNVTLLACNGWGVPSTEVYLKDVRSCQDSAAYIIRRGYALKLQTVWLDAAKQEIAYADQTWTPLQQSDGWGMTSPVLVKQGASYSDIAGKYVDHDSDLGKSSNKMSIAIPFCAYINLDKRADRRERLEQEMAKVGLVCQRVVAVKADASRNITAERGCIFSHIEALRHLRRSGARYGLILEDDAVWKDVDTAQSMLLKMPQAMRHHNVTLLACKGFGKPNAEYYLQDVLRCQTTSAYIIRRGYASKLQKVWEKAAQEDVAYADQSWKPYQQPDGWAMTNPLLVKQGASYSDIAGKDVEYPGFHNDGTVGCGLGEPQL